MAGLKSAYTILPNENLVLEFHRGVLKANSYISFKKELLKDPLFKANMNHFIHFKNVEFHTSPEDIGHFVDFVKDNNQSFGHRKIALITNTPNQVVSTTMYKMMQESSTQTAEVFSTNETALKWLNPPTLTIKELFRILSDLNKSCFIF